MSCHKDFGKKIIQRDFPKSKLSLLLSTKETYVSLCRKKQSFQRAGVELTDKISSLEDKMDKCSTTLKTKEAELNEILIHVFRFTCVTNC